MQNHLPTAYLDNLRPLLGRSLDDYIEALAQPPYRAFRLQRLSTSATEPFGHSESPLAAAMRLPVPESFHKEVLASPVDWHPDAFYLPPDHPLGKTLWHELGAVYIQEPSAMAAVTALSPVPGEQILDLCAAPGSKATAIGRALAGTGTLVCNEIHPARVQILAQNLERAGVPALVVSASPDQLASRWTGLFDAVLVDAPCSGEGMFRKDPDAISEWHEGLVAMCAERQREILAQAVQLVRPGGRLVYSTCTLNPVENEQVLAWACSNLPVEIEPLPEWPGWEPAHPEVAGGLSAISGARRLWPHRGKGEGHFVAKLRVISSLATRKPHPGKRKERNRSGQMAGMASDAGTALADWLHQDILPQNWLQPAIHGQGAFIETVSHLPLEGIRVVRNGICAAVLQGRDWKPHHQLAMSIRAGVAAREQALSAAEAAEYVAGASLAESEIRGVVWLHMQGLAVGFGKAVQGRINNGYPKGLRKPVLY